MTVEKSMTGLNEIVGVKHFPDGAKDACLQLGRRFKIGCKKSDASKEGAGTPGSGPKSTVSFVPGAVETVEVEPEGGGANGLDSVITGASDVPAVVVEEGEEPVDDVIGANRLETVG